MEVYHAIHQRRTIKNFTDEPVSKETLKRIFETGIWAQNHKLTQPWRFKVLGPQIREKLALSNELARQKIMSPPVLVAVSYVLASDLNTRREDYAATACAIQNMALAAWNDGIGMIWSTGKHTRDPQTAPVLGIDPVHEEIVGFLAFGFPAETPAAVPRKPVSDVLEFLS